MTHFVCKTCGVQFAARGDSPPPSCPICEDERQYVPESGQQWTTLDALRADHVNRIAPEGELTAIGTEPKFAIGQRALLVPWGERQLLWDCVTLLDDDTAEEVERRGGLAAIAISHPHYYSAMVDWGRRFGCPVHLHADDAEWVMRPDPVVELWDGERKDLGDGLTLIRCGGHFAGGTVLHWAGGAEGRGALLTGRHRPGHPGPPPRRLHVQLPEPDPAAGRRGRGDPRGARPVRVRGALRRLVGHRDRRTARAPSSARPRATCARSAEARAGRLQDRPEQAREARVEVLLAQRVHAARALLALLDDPGLAQHLEVMRAGRLGDGDVEAPAAAPFGDLEEAADHQQPDRVAERVEDGRELDLVAGRMGWRVRRKGTFSSECCTTIVVLC